MNKLPLAKKRFARGSGEQAVLRFNLISDHTDAELKDLSIVAQGDMKEHQAIARVRLYLDENRNGIADELNPIATGNFHEDNGTVKFNLNTPLALRVGDVQLIVTYEF